MILKLKRLDSDTFIAHFEGFSPKYHVFFEQVGQEGHPLHQLFQEFVKTRRPDFEVTARSGWRNCFTVRFSQGEYGEAAWVIKTLFEQFVAELWQYEMFRSFSGSDLISDVKFESWQPIDDIMFWLGGMRLDEWSVIKDYTQRLIADH